MNLPVALAAPRRLELVLPLQRGARRGELDLGGARASRAARSSSSRSARAARRSPRALGALLAAGARRGAGGDAPRAVRLATALALVVWIATNKVCSPQYALYGLLRGRARRGAALALPRPLRRLGGATSTSPSRCAPGAGSRPSATASSQPGHVVRTVLWLVLAAWIARELWRAASRARRQ